MELTVVTVTMIVLILAGLEIAYALGVTGILALLVHSGTRSLPALGSIGWNTTNDFVLTAVPLFIFMGEIVLGSGLSQGFFKGVNYWLRGLPGGLLHSVIVACAIFAAISGSSVATAAAIGTVAIPDMTSRRYDRKLVYGSLAAGGTLGILIPPSVPLIIYAAMVDQSVARLFAGGVVPGIIMAALFMLYTAIRVWLDPGLAPRETVGISWQERVRSLRGVLPMAVLIVMILGTIYAGVATPTEAAALGVAAAVVLSYFFGAMSLTSIQSALVRSVETTAMVLAIVIGAQIVSFALVSSGVSRELARWVVSLHLSGAMLILILTILYTFLGCIIDGISMMLLTLPLLYPITMAAGFDPVWFGVLLVIFIELGQITPPVGFNLFVLHGLSGGRPMGEIIMGALPYAVIMYVMVAVVSYWPQLVLWLPQQLVTK